MAQWVRAQDGQWFNLDQLNALSVYAPGDGTHIVQGTQVDYSNAVAFATFGTPEAAQAFLDDLFPKPPGT